MIWIFLVGAGTFAVGVMFGYAISMSALDRILKADVEKGK